MFERIKIWIKSLFSNDTEKDEHESMVEPRPAFPNGFPYPKNKFYDLQMEIDELFVDITASRSVGDNLLTNRLLAQVEKKMELQSVLSNPPVTTKEKRVVVGGSIL